MIVRLIIMRITIPQTIRLGIFLKVEGAFSSPVLQHSFILLLIALRHK